MQVLIAMVVAVFVVLGAPSGATADPGAAKPILVLESHVGPRSADVGRVMAALDELLETRGFAARPATLQRLAGPWVPRPGILDPALTTTEIAQHLSDGWKAFVAARWDEANDKLTRAIDEVHRNPELVVSDTRHLDRMFKAHVALAVSQQQRSDASGAARTMTELIRIFPSRPVERVEVWGREGERLYNNMLTQIQQRGRGRLSIDAGHSEAAIFVEGQLRGRNSVQLADLVPGTYRIFIKLPGLDGRQYEVQVAPDDDTHLKINSEMDATLRITDTWIGLEFATEAARAVDGKIAAEIARRWTKSDAVAVLAAGQDRRRPVLEGARYGDGVQLRRARIYTDRPDSPAVSQLARYLADGTPGPDLEILEVRRADVAPARIERRLRGQHIPFVVLGIGAVAALGSSMWYLASPDDDHTLPTYDNQRPPAIITFVSSSVAVGAGIYLYLQVSETADIAPAALLGAGAAALLAGGMLLAADQDPFVGLGYVRPTYRDSARLGLVVGGAGIVLTGVGVWLLGQERMDTALPVVTVERGGGSLGWTGRF